MDNLQPQEPGYECYQCGKGLWVSDEFRLWANYHMKPNQPSVPLCISCAMARDRPLPREVEP